MTTEQGTVTVPCPYKIPKTLLHKDGFLDFCHLSLGVSPGRVTTDIQAWLDEDHGSGDVTLFAAFEKNPEVTMCIVAKEDFVLCGLPIMAEIFRKVTDGNAALFSDHKDGDRISKGVVVLAATGKATGMLLGERVALNFACKMSGVATKTRSIVEMLSAAEGSKKPTLLETRKTTPGLRMYEKYATRTGGARNHRHGLDSGAMLKENHLRSIGSIPKALRALKAKLPVLTKIEIEVTNLAEFKSALDEGADIIMLDNFTREDVVQAVQVRKQSNKACLLELSGNLDADSVAHVSNLGVDFVSMGSLVHKAVWVDMSLQLFCESV